jgi:large subunit ribosomal protein L7Ae
VAPNPLAKKAETAKSTGNPLFEKRVRNFGIGGNIQPKRNLSRYVKWPKYIRFQRQRSVLLQRLKVPPQIAQFSLTAEKNLANEVFALLDKYRPEDKAQKKQRLQAAAEAKAAGKMVENVAPVTVKYGLNHVTALIENKKAKLVVIAHDVDPLELVVFLPALCKKMEVPYVIVKGRARLGTVVHQKTAAVAAIVDVRSEDRAQLTKVTESAVANFNDKYDVRRRTWGGQVMGIKSTTKANKIAAKLAKDQLAHSKF